MYLRETRRRNKDGTVVRYLQLAHNERHPASGVSTAKVIHNFGRADQVDRQALARLVASISRVLDPAEEALAGAAGEVSVLDSRPAGGAWALGELWRRLGIGEAIARVARGRRVGPEVERALFALVANRALDPLSKLAATRWVRERVFIEGLAELGDDAAYRAMDFLLEALPELQREVFFAVADLLNLEVDLLFFDTTSSYFESEGDPEGGLRRRGHSKDHRPDLPQVVIGMAVTRGGIPVRVWCFPGNAGDQELVRRAKADLAGWALNRVVWVADRGFASAENRRYLQRGGSHYILGEKLRSEQPEAQAALARQGRYRTVAHNLRVKEVVIDEGVMRDRFVICLNPEEAARDRAVREELLAQLRAEIASSDRRPAGERQALFGRLRSMPGYRRFLRQTPAGRLRVDRASVAAEARLDGKFLLRTSDRTLSAEDIALGYKALLEAERGWRDLKGTLELRPVHHRRADRIEAHVQLCWLALLLVRVIEAGTADTWRNVRHELERMHLVTLATGEGTVAQRSQTTPGQRQILALLGLPEPPRYFDFRPAPG
ncbi:MAG: IS1634 family transposase [Thermoleophilia bacterium]|nr:IS1634 family transposase [Thermoleophilia bacterium]